METSRRRRVAGTPHSRPRGMKRRKREHDAAGRMGRKERGGEGTRMERNEERKGWEEGERAWLIAHRWWERDRASDREERVKRRGERARDDDDDDDDDAIARKARRQRRRFHTQGIGRHIAGQGKAESGIQAATAAEVSPLLIITAWRASERASACQASIIATNGLAANNIRRHRQLFAVFLASLLACLPACLLACLLACFLFGCVDTHLLHYLYE